MRLADGLGVKPVRIDGPPRVPSVTSRLGPRFGAGWADAGRNPPNAAAAPAPAARRSLRVNISSSSAPQLGHRPFWRNKATEEIGRPKPRREIGRAKPKSPGITEGAGALPAAHQLEPHRALELAGGLAPAV